MYKTSRGRRHGRTIVRCLATVVAVLVIASAAGAQEEVNNRDEVVNLFTGGGREGEDEVIKIFRPATKRDSQNYVVKLIELKYAPASEVAEYVDEAVEFEGGLSKALEYIDPATKETHHLLQVVTTPDQMPSIQELVKGLDLPGLRESTSDPNYEVRMRYRKASEVAEILGSLDVEEVLSDDSTHDYAKGQKEPPCRHD